MYIEVILYLFIYVYLVYYVSPNMEWFEYNIALSIWKKKKKSGESQLDLA